MSLSTVLIVVVAVALVMGRRMVGQLVEAKRLLVLPVVLCAIGVSQLGSVHRVDAVTIGLVLLSIAISVGLGVLRGTTVHLGVRDGQAWMRYRASTVVLWLVNLAAKAALYPVERAVSQSTAQVAEHALVLSFGLGIAAESLVVLLRALHREEPLVWAKGADGGPHRTSQTLDRLQQQLRTPSTTTAPSTGRTWRTELSDLARAARRSRDW